MFEDKLEADTSLGLEHGRHRNKYINETDLDANGVLGMELTKAMACPGAKARAPGKMEQRGRDKV